MKTHNPRGGNHISFFIVECGIVPLTSMSSQNLRGRENQGTYLGAQL